jgi:hypothetical protein
MGIRHFVLSPNTKGPLYENDEMYQPDATIVIY